MSIWGVPMLDVSQINLKYGQSQILYDVSLAAEVGKITAVMGNNGVGKTSLLKAVSGRHPVTGGDVSVSGKKVQLSSAYHSARAGIAYVPQGREVFPMMTVRENLETGFACLAQEDHNIPSFVFELFPVLSEMQLRRGGDLSGGQQQQLAIARALITKPSVLLLDEPTEGIQPNVIQQIGDALETLRDKGEMAIVLVEQNADFAYDISDRFTVIEQGRVKRSDAKVTYSRDQLMLDLAL